MNAAGRPSGNVNISLRATPYNSGDWFVLFFVCDYVIVSYLRLIDEGILSPATEITTIRSLVDNR